MKKPLMVAASGLAGLTIGLAGCGDDKGDGGGGTSTFPTVTTGVTTEDTGTGFTATGENESTTTTGENEGTTTGEDNGGGGGDDG
jgi:hypothetical protein